MKKVLYLCLLLVFTTHTFAQDKNNQQVKVVKPYEPVISDAYKINELPHIVDTTIIKPKFVYNITPVQYKTHFNPKVLRPAKLKSEALQKLYYGYARLGFGNYLSPLAEVAINSKRSERWQWSSVLHYQSSNGKVKNADKERVYAGVSDFTANADAKHFFKNRTVAKLNVGYNNAESYFYGYSPKTITTDAEPPLKKADIEKQQLNTVNLSASYGTNYLDSSRINYTIYIKNLFTKTIDKYNENLFDIGTKMNYFFEHKMVGVNINIKNVNNSGFTDTTNNNFVRFNPWVGAFGKKWRIVAGVNTYFNSENSKYHFYPQLSMHYNIIDYFLIPYFQISGNHKVNNFTKLYHENHFINNGLKVKPTNNKVNISFGFRGNISSEIAFNLRADYSKFEDYYFYVNDTALQYDNKFTVVYDDLTQTHFLGEISYKHKGKLYASLKGEFYKNTLKDYDYAWHLPDYKVSLHTRYSIQDKIIANLNIFGIGKRYALEYDETNTQKAVSLKGLIDVNIGLEYRYTKRLSAFLNINNILAQKYYKWNNYPRQQFFIMGGVSYCF